MASGPKHIPKGGTGSGETLAVGASSQASKNSSEVHADDGDSSSRLNTSSSQRTSSSRNRAEPPPPTPKTSVGSDTSRPGTSSRPPSSAIRSPWPPREASRPPPLPRVLDPSTSQPVSPSNIRAALTSKSPKNLTVGFRPMSSGSESGEGQRRPTPSLRKQGTLSTLGGRLRNALLEDDDLEERNDWDDDRVGMELAVMMGMHTRLGGLSPLRILRNEGPGLHLMIMYGQHALLTLRDDAYTSTEGESVTSGDVEIGFEDGSILHVLDENTTQESQNIQAGAGNIGVGGSPTWRSGLKSQDELALSTGGGPEAVSSPSSKSVSSPSSRAYQRMGSILFTDSKSVAEAHHESEGVYAGGSEPVSLTGIPVIGRPKSKHSKSFGSFGLRARSISGYWGGKMSDEVRRLLRSEGGIRRVGRGVSVLGLSVPPESDDDTATQIFCVDDVFFLEVGERWLVRRNKNVAMRAVHMYAHRGGAGPEEVAWRKMLYEHFVRQEYAPGGALEASELTRTALRNILKQVVPVEGKRLLYPDLSEALRQLRRAHEWGGELNELSEVDIAEKMRKEKAIMVRCCNGLLENEKKGIPALAELGEGGVAAMRTWTLGPPAVVQSTRTSKHPGLYAVDADAHTWPADIDEFSADSPLKLPNPKGEAEVQARNAIAAALCKAKEEVQRLNASLQNKSAQIRYLRTQHSHAALQLGDLRGLLLEVDEIRAEIKRKEALAQRLSSACVLNVAETVVQNAEHKVSLGHLRAHVRGLHDAIAALNAEASELVLQLQKDHGLCVRGTSETEYYNFEWAHNEVSRPWSADPKLRRLEQIRVEVKSKNDMIKKLDDRLAKYGSVII